MALIFCDDVPGNKKWKPVIQLDNCHDDLINAISISPDGEYFLSISQDDTINTWRCDDVLNKTNMAPQSMEYFANNNDNRRWLSSIKPVFDPKHDHAFIMGSMEPERCVKFFRMSDRPESSSVHIAAVHRYYDEVTDVLSYCYI